MSGEDTGLEALASPQAGYLGKVKRASSLDHCPWCSAKGLTFSLRSYRINLQESITLCTNSQCLFPLVTRPLEDILSTLDLTKSNVENKRKNNFALENEELVKLPVKRQRTSKDADVEHQSGIQTDHDVGSPIRNDIHQPFEEDGKSQKVSIDAETVESNSLPDQDVPESSETWTDDCALEELPSKSLVATVENEASIPPHLGSLDIPDKRIPTLDTFNDPDLCSMEVDVPLSPTLKAEENSPNADIILCKDSKSSKPESEDLQKSNKRVSVPKRLFWSNRDNLCWLDSLMVALVNCKSLRKSKPKEEPQHSSVWQLMTKYDDICTSIKMHQQTDKDGLAWVPSHVLHRANSDLESLRKSLFRELQPKLHCKLGQRETPVFAMPLLLTMDSWAEPLFQLTFLWEFQCRECKATSKERVITKTLTTFTKVVSDWHPQHAVHFSPCNSCSKPNQMRTMRLERVPEVFALHFVEGLPQNDVKLYSFSFDGKQYSITTVIQYDQQLQHFVTWTRKRDGSWLEYDDLKHPECKIHQELPVPTPEMHVVFWEEELEEPSVCSPSSTFVQSPPPESIPCLMDGDMDMDVDVDTPSAANPDASIGVTTLLDAFEGLNHNDIVTLTLVELKTDCETHLNDNEQAQDFRVSSREEKFPSSPDSSSPTTINVCQSAEPPATQLRQNHPHQLPTTLRPAKPLHSTPNPIKKPPAPIGLTKDSHIQNLPSSPKHPSKVPPGLSDTEALRYKLIKKLKAKKKKLAKLNQQLGNQGGTFLLPDSTALTSPSTVSSSTYDGSTCDDFLSDLFSPATTASNVSPDSTGFLEMLANGQNVPETLNSAVSDNNIESRTNCATNEPDPENFLEMFLSQCC
uniref:Ubiquitin specific peptidase like 1 n=1 Tax=Oryzias melastigma TaxID=30732 RepID=A0A3B3BZT5_ORYME